jgi:hypothetical protein
METSKHHDRERRRTKLKTRSSWTKVLLHPKTVTLLISAGKFITHLVWLYYLIIKVFRE